MDQTSPSSPINPQANQSDNIISPVSKPSRKIKEYDKKVHGRRYSIANRVAIKSFQNTGMSAEQVGPLTNAHPKTIVRIWNDPELDDLSTQAVSKTKNGMAGLFYKRGLQGLLAMTPEKYSQSSLLQIATTVGIMTEKGRLMEGLSTDNVSHRSVISHIEGEVTKLDKLLQSLDDGSST